MFIRLQLNQKQVAPVSRQLIRNQERESVYYTKEGPLLEGSRVYEYSIQFHSRQIQTML